MLKLSSNTLATWCEELTHWKRPWCWERLRSGGEGDSRGWDGWMASPTWWTWVWASSRSWRWTGRPGVLQSMRSQRVRYDWATKLNWIYPKYYHSICNQYKQSLRCFTFFCTESSKSGLCLDFIKYAVKKVDSWYYPGGPMAKIPYSQCRGFRFDSWLGNWVAYSTTKDPAYCN